MTTPKPRESLCAVTGKPCDWYSDDEYDDNGEAIAWDLFCGDCKRARDWDLDEALDPDEPVPSDKKAT